MLTLAVVALLTLTDPVSDIGNGAVRPPTAAISRPIGALDVTQLEFYDTEAVTFSLTLASLTDPFDLRNGFTFPVIEVYLDDYSDTGSTSLIPGSGMRLPGGANWKYAFKLTGDTLQVFEATTDGWQEVLGQYPTTVSVQGNSIVVSSSLPYPERFDAYGMVGSYTPFNETGWMPLSRTLSPWAYSSSSQTFPVLDVIAPTFEAQRNALASGVLPVIKPPRPVNPWIFVMVGGILLALVGVLLRFVPNRKTSPAFSPAPKPATVQPGPYQAEPLKPSLPKRTTTLQNLTEDEAVMPAHLMAAERARTMITGDRVARERPRPEMGLESNADATSEIVENKATENVDASEGLAIENPSMVGNPNEVKTEHVSSSTAIPLFQAPKIQVAPPVLPLPSKLELPLQQTSKTDFGASGLESWNDYDDELANFDWSKSNVNVKAEAAKATVEEQKPDSNS